MCINTNSFGCSGRCFLNFHVYIKHMVCVLVIQSCPALWEPMDGSLPGFSVHGILQARIVESVGCHALLQGIFPTQVFRIVGRFFTDWTTREAKHMEVVSALWAQAVIWQVGFCLGTESLRFLSPSRRHLMLLCPVLSAQSCPALWFHHREWWGAGGCTPAGSFIQRVFWARILEWVAISYSRRSVQPGDWTCDP